MRIIIALFVAPLTLAACAEPTGEPPTPALTTTSPLAGEVIAEGDLQDNETERRLEAVDAY